MKKLEIIIRPEKLEDLKEVLNDENSKGAMITNILGYGNQKGYKQFYRGAEIVVKMLPKIKVETVVDDETAERIIKVVVERISSGSYGDGKIFIYDMEDTVRIRTGEHGEEAL